MKILLTGGTGFVGSHLAKRLVQDGHQLTISTRQSTPPTYLEELPITWETGELTSQDFLQAIVKNQDIVIHNAGAVTALNPKTYYTANVQATHLLLEALHSTTPKLKRFIYISSQAAVGPSPTAEPVDETLLPAPITNYGMSKFQAEQRVLEYKESFPISILRPCGVYGPRDTSYLEMFKLAHKGKFIIAGSGNQLLNFIHVNDLVQAILGMFKATHQAETYFVTGEGAYNWLDIHRITQTAVGKPLRVLHIPLLVAQMTGIVLGIAAQMTRKPTILDADKTKEMAKPYWVVSHDKIKQELGYQPTINLEEGFKETYSWYLENQWI